MELLAKVTLAHGNGIVADSATNSFAVSGFTPTGVLELAELTIPFINFYNETPTGALIPIADLLSPELDHASNRCKVDLFDVTDHLDGSPAGSPIYSTPWTLNAPAIGASLRALPGEVAYCVTLEAFNREDQLVEAPDGPDAGTAVDRPRQRYTGRIFLGPLAQNTLDAPAWGSARPDTNIRDTSHLAIVQLAEDIRDVYATADLAVWSRKDAVMRRVDNVSSDNAFDTIRSRGVSATARVRVDV